MNYDINIPKLLNGKNIIKISDNSWIEKNLYEKRGDKYYEVLLYLDGKEIFIGKFNKDDYTLDVKYNNGKIIVLNTAFNDSTSSFDIVKVLSLYDILDDTFYCSEEEEALALFDDKLDSSHLKDKNKYMIRVDIEKNRRLK